MLRGVKAAFKRSFEPLGDALLLCGLQPRRHGLPVPDPDATTTSGVDMFPQPRPDPLDAWQLLLHTPELRDGAKGCGLPWSLPTRMSGDMALWDNGDITSSASLILGETGGHLLDGMLATAISVSEASLGSKVEPASTAAPANAGSNSSAASVLLVPRSNNSSDGLSPAGTASAKVLPTLDEGSSIPPRVLMAIGSNTSASSLVRRASNSCSVSYTCAAIEREVPDDAYDAVPPRLDSPRTTSSAG
mmetsp:Transcript_25833/g.50587  ORF Transcript_25833/g.50587 Transcript_25833/m.50587 type:complete len:246 (-) Transcript_25833:592-1329(-)